VSDLPDDLMTVRDAEEQCRDIGLSMSMIRGWIYTGKGGKHLRTYRRPGEPDRCLVSLAEVRAWAARSYRNGIRTHATLNDDERCRTRRKGRLTVSFTEVNATQVRLLSRLIAQRLGCSEVSSGDALMIAVANEIRRSESALAARLDAPKEPQ